MVAKETPTRTRIAMLLDALSEEALAEVVSFLEFQRFKLEQRAQHSQRPTPIKLGGLWEGIEITDEDIEAVRREMWDGIEERFT
jgi:hypothetical protein